MMKIKPIRDRELQLLGLGNGRTAGLRTDD